MFILSTIQDNVRIKPQSFNELPSLAITDELNSKYANKIIHDVGLGIKVFDISSISDPIVLACQDGSYQSRVVFRLVVFRPFKGEVLVGKVKDGSLTHGLKVSLGFFDDIIIPPAFLMPGTEFDATEGVWVWKYEGNDLYMDPEQDIRIRVENEVFIDVGPVRKPKDGITQDPVPEVPWSKNAPYTIIASASESGMGLLSWWE